MRISETMSILLFMKSSGIQGQSTQRKILSAQKLGVHDDFALISFIVKTMNKSNCFIISSLSLVSTVRYEKLLRSTKVSKRKKKLKSDLFMNTL